MRCIIVVTAVVMDVVVDIVGAVMRVTVVKTPIIVRGVYTRKRNHMTKLLHGVLFFSLVVLPYVWRYDVAVRALLTMAFIALFLL